MTGADLHLVEDHDEPAEVIVVVELPAPLELVNSVLTQLGRRWPNSTVTNTNAGYRIRIKQ